MRAARLINLVLLLQNRETMTAAELAGELEVSERTVYRDVEALSAAGVPVYAERGRAGGYRLVGGYRTRLTGLSRQEAEALFLSGLGGSAEQLGLAEALATARLKVSAALPPPLRDAAERTGQRFHLDAPGWFADREQPPALTSLATALWRDRVVRLRYRRGESEVERTVEPYGLVLKAGVWYLVARVGTGHRTYRVDRVLAAVETGGLFQRDLGFDLAGYWAAGAAEFAAALLTETAGVRLSPAGASGLHRAVGRLAAERALAVAGPPDRYGWVETELPVESVPVAASQLLGLGAEVEVLYPPELREQLAETADRLAALYR